VTDPPTAQPCKANATKSSREPFSSRRRFETYSVPRAPGRIGPYWPAL